jgi:hypothetical protein
MQASDWLSGKKILPLRVLIQSVSRDRNRTENSDSETLATCQSHKSSMRACTTRALSPGARVKILAVMPNSHPMLGFWLASTQLFASALGEFRPRSASVGR